MRGKGWGCFFLIFTIMFCFNVNAAGNNEGNRSSGRGIVQILHPDEERPKVISVILDNSNSMVEKEGSKKPTTRWIEADYTVKALAAMMDSQDELRLYIMSGYRVDKNSEYSTPGTFDIGIEKNSTIQKINQYLENMPFSNLTYFQGVTGAAEDMKDDLADGKDCWIVILTDGSFWEPERMDAAMLTEELYKITTPGEHGRIQVAYIPVGDEDEIVKIAEDTKNGIYVANVVQGEDYEQESVILKKVTDTINRIYGRVRLEEDIEGKYLPEKQGQIQFDIDIPLERLIVFMQQSGKEERYKEFDNRLSALERAGNTTGDGRAEIIIGPPSVPDFLESSDQAEFEGRRKIPYYEDGEPDKYTSQAIYKDLQGRMISYIKNQNKFSEQSLSIPINNNNSPDVEVYYQPAVKIGIEYLQNGEPVQHTDKCLETINQAGHVERCLQEGEVTVRLKLMDESGNELPNMNSGLLYKDKFKVALSSLNNEVQQIELTGENYEFTGIIQEKDYKMMVTTPWGIQDVGAVIVQEKLKDLDISLDGADEIWMNDSEDGANLIRVRIDEDGLIPSWEIIEQMTVECACSSEKLEIEPVESLEQGVWLFRPVPKDPHDHHVEKETQIHISASRPYYVRGVDTGDEVRKSVTAEKGFTLPIFSHPEELSVSMKSENAISAYSLLWPLLGQKKLLVYVCKDILDEDQMEEVVNEDFVVDPEDLTDYISLGKDGNIHIKSGFFKWFFMDQDKAAITFRSSYNLWNTQNDADVSLLLTFKAIPAWVRFLAIVGFIIIIFWGCAILIRNMTPLYIRSFKATLTSNNVGMAYSMNLNRRKHMICPWYKYAILSYENGKDVEASFMPTIRLKIYNNRYGKGYVIKNYMEFQNSDKFKIDGMVITKDNRIFSDAKLFSVKDERGVTFYMTI